MRGRRQRIDSASTTIGRSHRIRDIARGGMGQLPGKRRRTLAQARWRVGRLSETLATG